MVRSPLSLIFGSVEAALASFTAPSASTPVFVFSRAMFTSMKQSIGSFARLFISWASSIEVYRLYAVEDLDRELDLVLLEADKAI